MLSNCSLASQHTVEDGPGVPLASTPPTTGGCFPRGKEGTAPHAVPDAVHNHGNEGGCCCSSVQHLEHSILAVRVLLCKQVGHVDGGCADLGKVVVDPVAAQLLHQLLWDQACVCNTRFHKSGSDCHPIGSRCLTS